jgi:hypothetical protein
MAHASGPAIDGFILADSSIRFPVSTGKVLQQEGRV